MLSTLYLTTIAVCLSARQTTARPHPQTTVAPDGYWVAEIFMNGCAIADDNQRYTFNGQEALPCTSIQGYGYQSVNFDDSTGSWAINVFTDLECTVPLIENLSDNQCITSPQGQFVTAISITPR